jgi:hypothetical protein
MSALPLLAGVVFGVLAGICAFLISYDEYQRHFAHGHRPLRMALGSAAVAGAFFFVLGGLVFAWLG